MPNPATLQAEGLLAQYLPGGQPLAVEPGQSIRQAARAAGIPASKPFAALLNGQVVELDTILQPGDDLRLLPQISGG